MTGTTPKPHVGGVIDIDPRHTGEPRKVGEILEVIDEGGHQRLRVRWDDGHESIYYPSTDAHVR